MAKDWSGRGNSDGLKFDGTGHTQRGRDAVVDIEEPVAGNGGHRGSGVSPTDITLSNDSVVENSAGGTVIGILGAVDADNGERFRFSLIDDADGLFAISGSNRLVVADGAEIDFEAGATRQITVLVTDKKGNTYQETMTISIEDVVEALNSAPTDITLTNTAVDENSAGGTVIGVLGNNDPDAGDSWTYVITSDPDQKFQIVDGRLAVRSGATLDYETAQSHSVTVQVTDSSGSSFLETFLIDVRDVLESQNSAPTDITLTNTAVDENSAGGTVIGVLGNNDPDAGDSWTYVITSDPDQKFQIVDGRLAVRSGATLDYETAQSHSVTVQVTDSAGASFLETFTIDVRDVLEVQNSAPTDMEISGNSVTEGAANGTLVGVLTAVDPDSGETFTYTLLDSAGGRFTLDGDRLEIGNESLIDYETDTSHSVTVQVTDSAGNTYNETFTIQVQDVAGSLADQPNYIQALISAQNGEAYYFWPDSDTSTAPTTITFAILTDFPSYYNASTMPYTSYTSGAVAFDQLTAAQLTAISQLLGEIEDFANVEFVEVGSASQANITFGMYYQDSGIGAYAYYPSAYGSTNTKSGDVWLNSRYDTNPSTSETSGADWARSAIAHELGHAMGLKHPGNYNAGGGGTPGPYLDSAVDNGQYTVMSYNDFPYSGADPVDYMLYDIATLQYLYGANMNHATGNDVYAFSTSSNLIDTIWDAGGFDTISVAGSASAVTIDLNQGGFSSIGLTNNIGIAYGAEIEAAVGGSGGDILIGNSLDNSFTGGGGADTFVFADNWGTDIVLDFQNGLDKLDLSGSGLLYVDLTIGNGGSGAEISAGGSTVVLSGIDASLIDQNDFVFV